MDKNLISKWKSPSFELFLTGSCTSDKFERVEVKNREQNVPFIRCKIESKVSSCCRACVCLYLQINRMFSIFHWRREARSWGIVRFVIRIRIDWVGVRFLSTFLTFWSQSQAACSIFLLARRTVLNCYSRQIAEMKVIRRKASKILPYRYKGDFRNIGLVGSSPVEPDCVSTFE